LHILIDYRPALRDRTGVGEYVHHLSDALLRRISPPDQVTLFSSSWKDRLDRAVLPRASRLDARVPVRVLNLAWHRLEWPPVEVFGVRPDVTWSLHPLLMPARSAARVVTVHDLFFLDHPAATAREVRRDYASLAPAHVARADAVVVNSEYTRQSVVRRLKVSADRITVCYPGAPAWPVRPTPERGGPILHVGTIEPRKNIGALLRAYGTLAAARGLPRLLFAGRIAAGVDLDALIRGAGLSAADCSLEFRGYVSEEEKVQLYRDASLLVVASADEGFGIPALEAMAVGLPVVASNRGSLPEVVGDAGLLVDPDDPEALASAIASVLDDPSLRQSLRERGFRRAAGFSWETSAERLLRTFRQAVRQRGPHADPPRTRAAADDAPHR
jgi:glycosyltransferase involved in cell wall biosynthesis